MKKKILSGALVVLMLGGLFGFTSCDTGDNNENDNNNTTNTEGNSYNGKTVDERFIGNWETGEGSYIWPIDFEITKTAINWDYGLRPAWSEGDNFYFYYVSKEHSGSLSGDTLTLTIQGITTPITYVCKRKSE